MSKIYSRVALDDASGVSFIDRIGGQVQVSNDAGASFGPLGGGGGLGGYQMKYLVDAQTALGTANLSHYWNDFWSQTDLNIILAGGGVLTTLSDTADSVRSIGGVVKMNTSVGTTGSSRFIPPNTGTFPPTCSYNNPNVKFYRACRFALISAADANTFAWVGSQGANVGVHGANSTTKYSARLRSTSVGSPVYLTSTVTIDGEFHIIRHWHDGVRFYLSVDGETPVSAPSASSWPISNATESMYDVITTKLGGAVDVTTYLDWALWATAST